MKKMFVAFVLVLASGCGDNAVGPPPACEDVCDVYKCSGVGLCECQYASEVVCLATCSDLCKDNGWREDGDTYVCDVAAPRMECAP